MNIKSWVVLCIVGMLVMGVVLSMPGQISNPTGGSSLPGAGTNPFVATSTLQLPAGTAGAPAVQLGGAVDGLYQFGTHQIGIVSNGFLVGNLNGGSGLSLNSASCIAFTGSGTGTGGNPEICGNTTGLVTFGTTYLGADATIKSGAYATGTNCQLGGASGTTSPAACGSAAAGSIAIPASQTSYVVNTTAVTANSHIIVQQITDNSGISSATCNSGSITPIQSARTAATSFTVTITSVASVTCIQYWIID